MSSSRMRERPTSLIMLLARLRRSRRVLLSRFLTACMPYSEMELSARLSSVKLGEEGVLVGFEDGDELHDGVDSEAHRVEVEHVRELLGVDLVQALLEHLGLLEVRLLARVLAAGEEDVCVCCTVPAWNSSSKMEVISLGSACCSPCRFDNVLFM